MFKCCHTGFLGNVFCKVFVKKLHGRFRVEVLSETWLDLAESEPQP